MPLLRDYVKKESPNALSNGYDGWTQRHKGAVNLTGVNTELGGSHATMAEE
jgi:hypothetical protein